MLRLAAALVACLLTLWISACDGRATPEVHLIPEGYSGWVAILYKPGGATLPVEEGARVYAIPDSGVLHLDAEPNDGLFPKGSMRFFYTSASGERRELPRSWDSEVPGDEPAVWRLVTLGIDVSCGEPSGGGIVYAVGTPEEYDTLSAQLHPFMERVASLPPCPGE